MTPCGPSVGGTDFPNDGVVCCRHLLLPFQHEAPAVPGARLRIAYIVTPSVSIVAAFSREWGGRDLDSTVGRGFSPNAPRQSSPRSPVTNPHHEPSGKNPGRSSDPGPGSARGHRERNLFGDDRLELFQHRASGCRRRVDERIGADHSQMVPVIRRKLGQVHQLGS